MLVVTYNAVKVMQGDKPHITRRAAFGFGQVPGNVPQQRRLRQPDNRPPVGSFC
jgi:hypothetical protein